MRGLTILPISFLSLMLCAPLSANEPEDFQTDEFTSEAINQCEYWASVSEVSPDEQVEYVENCVIEELAAYTNYPSVNDLPESFDAPTIWE